MTSLLAFAAPLRSPLASSLRNEAPRLVVQSRISARASNSTLSLSRHISSSPLLSSSQPLLAFGARSPSQDALASASCARRLLSSSSRSASEPPVESLSPPSSADAGTALSGLTDRNRPALRSIYLDMQATTPVDPRVLDAMLPLYTEHYGNPHSRTHMYGWEAERMVEDARGSVANVIGADPLEIVFTSGATESNNIALKGVTRFYGHKGSSKKHIITTVTEHKCVLDSCRALQQEGFDVTYLAVQKNGLVDLNAFEEAIRPETILASVMFVNNEIGVIQPIAELGRICRKHKVFFHTDAAQAVGKVPIDVNAMNIDLLSVSGHKLYGPKGVGALYVRRRPRVRVEPVISGGGQERNIRSGTVPSTLVVGLGAACRIATEEMQRDSAHIQRLWNKLHAGITTQIPDTVLNGDAVHRYYGNLNISFAFVEGESLLMALKEVACSSGSACTSASLEPSYVLRSLGIDDELAHSSIRFGIGRFTSDAEIEHAIALCVKHVQRLRDMSPLWEMHSEGIDLKTIQWSQH